jgi:hypothetical protein
MRVTNRETLEARFALRQRILPGLASLVHSLWCLCNGAGIAEVSGALSATYLAAALAQGAGSVALLARRPWGSKLAAAGHAAFGLTTLSLAVWSLIDEFDAHGFAWSLASSGVALALATWLWRVRGAPGAGPRAPFTQ